MEQGINAFLLNCRTNDKMAKVEAQFGVKGFAVIVKLWQKIYSEKGYYCKWDNGADLLFLSYWFGGSSGVSLDNISKVVNYALNIGLFDKNKFKEHGILTSGRIQRQYFDVVKRRKVIKVRSDYLLVNVRNLCEKAEVVEEDADILIKNDDISKTSKEKESKEKQSKEKCVKECTHFVKPTVEEIFEYCRERGNIVDPERFFDYYEATGWKIGNTQMNDWKAAVRNWERNGLDIKPTIEKRTGGNPFREAMEEMRQMGNLRKEGDFIDI